MIEVIVFLFGGLIIFTIIECVSDLITEWRDRHDNRRYK